MADGGYDEGYTKCQLFWGSTPAEMVIEAINLLPPLGVRRTALDLGCGEGKNSAAMSDAGFRVLAIDTSDAAIANAIRTHDAKTIQWLVADMLAIRGPAKAFDLVIATGSLHCLSSPAEIEQAVRTIQHMTKIGGLNVIYSFDDGSHDMSGHAPSFKPTLLGHYQYLDFYSDWEVMRATTVVQSDRHPHNEIDHHHSITRLLARRSL